MNVMEGFVEQIVRRRYTAREWLLSVLYGAGAVILGTAELLFLSKLLSLMVALILCVVTMYGAYWLLCGLNTECEYCIVSGDLDIDFIYGRRKRRRIVSVHGNKIQSAAPYRPEKWAGQSFDRTVLAASSPDASGVWAFTYTSKKNGCTLVLFEPNERTLQAFLSILPRSMQTEVKREAGIQ